MASTNGVFPLIFDPKTALYVLHFMPKPYFFASEVLDIIRTILSAVECFQSHFASLVSLDIPDIRRTSAYNSFHSL